MYYLFLYNFSDLANINDKVYVVFIFENFVY